MPKTPKGNDEQPPELTDQIGDNLKALYDKTLSEEIPDRLLDLLKELQKQDKARE